MLRLAEAVLHQIGTLVGVIKNVDPKQTVVKTQSLIDVGIEGGAHNKFELDATAHIDCLGAQPKSLVHLLTAHHPPTERDFS